MMNRTNNAHAMPGKVEIICVWVVGKQSASPDTKARLSKAPKR